MKIQVIERELNTRYNTPEGLLNVPNLPVYDSRQKNPYLAVWCADKGKAQTFTGRRRVIAEVGEYGHLVNKKGVSLGHEHGFYDLDADYEDAMGEIQKQIHKAVMGVAEAADKARSVIEGEENFVRVIHFIKLHFMVETVEGGWYFRRLSAFVAEAFSETDGEIRGF